MLRARSCSGLLLTCALGCAASPSSTTQTSSSAESTGSTGTGTGSEATTFDGPRACGASSECDDGRCVAPYDPGAGTGSAGMGEPVCVPECVLEDALDRWCIDDGACCEGLVCDTRDGFCVAPDPGTESTLGETWTSVSESTSGASSSDTSTGGSSGTDDGGSSSSGG